jgi:hypothetical protein
VQRLGDTGIVIRALMGGRWRNVDIANQHLTAPQLLEWLAGLDSGAVARTLVIVRESMQHCDPPEEQRP